MDSLKAKAFFSRPFDDRVKGAVAAIEAICHGLDITTVAVSEASPDVPSTEANTLIRSSDFLIALCTKVHKIDSKDEFLTSTSVREEIAAAQALGKKVVFFFEQGVAPDGFAHNRATSKVLDNCESPTAADIESLVLGIHRTKLQAVRAAEDVFHATGVKNFHISRLMARFQLRNSPEGLLWEYTTEKDFVFEAEHDLPITSAAYCMQQLKGCECAPLHKGEFRRNGVDVFPKVDALKERGFIELKTRFDPLPKAGDRLFTREKFQSPFLGPIYSDNPLSPVTIRGKKYNAYDGLAIVHRIQSFILRFVFPEHLDIRNFVPVVATFSKTLDYVNEDEVDRILGEHLLTVDSFDGSTIVSLDIDRPMYHYFYGIAWRLPPRLPESPPVAAEPAEWIT